MSTIQYVTVAQALASTSSGLNVMDTAANIAAALPNASLTSRVSSFSLSASGTLAGAALAKLAALPDFSVNGFQLTVSDAAYVLLSLSKAETKLITNATLTGSPTLNAAQLTQLEALPGFAVAGGDHVAVSDNLANIAAAIGTHPAWFTPVSAVAVRLDGSHVGAFAAAQLGLLEAAGKTVTFTTSGSNTTLTVAAAATNIAANAAGLNDLNGHVTVSYSVTNPGVAVSAADGAALAGLAGFNVGALSVSDTGAAITAHAAALFGHGFTSIAVSSGNFAGTSSDLLDPALHVAAGATVSLGTSATVSATAANTLAALPGFAVAAGATLTVQDSVANLLALSGAAENAAGVVELTASQVVTVAQLQALAALGSKFHEAGFTLSAEDSAAALEAIPSQALALAAHVTVLDTAANILTATLHNWGAVVPSYALSASGTVSGAQATALAGLGASFSLNSKTLSVQDNAAGVTAAAAALASLGIQANVTDTVAGLSGNEAALAQLGSALNSVTISDPSSASAQTAASLAPLAAKFAPASTLTVLDGAANVATYLSPLETIAAKLGTHLTLEISGTPAQLAGDVTAFAGSGAVLQLSVSGGGTVMAAQAAALAPYLANTTLNVSDTGANVAQYASQLAAAGSQIGTVTLSDVGSTYSAAVAAGIASVDSHLANGVLLSVNDSAANIGLAVAGLTKLATDGRLAGISDNFDSAAGVAANVAALNAVQAHVTVQDTTADVQAHIDALGQVQGLSRVTLTDIGGQTPYLSFGVGQLTSDAALLTAVRAVTNNYTVNVSDSVANIAADLGSANSAIVTDLAKIRSVTSPAGPISLTWAQEQTLVTSAGVHLQNVLALLTGGWTVTGVPLETTTGGNTVDNLAALAAYTHPPSEIVVADTAAHISANLANTYGTVITGYTNIDGITVTDGQPVTLSVSQLGSLALLFSQSTKLTVQDSAADIVSDIASPQSALIAEVIANPAAITAITLSPNAGLSLTLTPAEALQLANAHALTTFTNLLPAGTILSVGATVADLATVAAIPAGQLGHLTVTVTDSPANLAADLLSGNSLLQRYSETISSVTLQAIANSPSLTAAGMAALYTYGFSQPPAPTAAVPLVVSDTLANVLAVPAVALEQANTTLTISDAAASLNTALASLTTAAQLEALATAIAGVGSSHLVITLTDTTPVVNVSAAVYHSNATLLDTISNLDPISSRGPVIVTDNATNLDAYHVALVADNHVGKVVVVDNVANVLTGSNLADLQQLGTRLWIQLTDAQLTYTQLTTNANLLLTAHLSTTGAGVFDTVANLVSLAGDGAAAVAFMNTYGATVTSSPANGISVTALQTLEGLTDLHTNGLTFSVADSYQNLTGVGAAAVLGSNLVSGVYLTASAANITAAQAVALYNIHNFHASTITGTAEPVSVSDTAANIDAVYSQLMALGTQALPIAVTGNPAISAATLGDLQALGATGTVTVSDTPANVANALATQPLAPTISPTSWTLSTTGPATIAQAVALGAAEHANLLTIPGSDAVIVNLNADTTLTAAQATDLGYLGTNLDLTLNGHHLTVTDTAANLAALTGPEVTHVLPGAAIVVNDTTGISESTASGFVTWLHNAGVTPAQLSFAHVESVTGSIANLQAFVAQLQTFTGINGAWPGNTSLPSSFQLTASDSYANLVGLTAGNNAAFLATLQGTTYDVADNGPLTAAQAQTLATIASQIHFSAGTTMVVQDSAASLLAAANQAGVALASTVELTGTPTLDASDALAVLSLHNLALTTHQLTINDTAQNLLNPALDALLTGPAFTGDITVTRSDSAAVTVQQAQTLAAIGVTGSPAIADTAANLINPANTTVLSHATTVALSDNETVTAATAAQVEAALNTYGTLSSNLAASTGTLTLAASATVDAPTLLAIANLGTHFSAGSNTLTLASNTSNLTLNESQFEALQNDNVALNGNTVTVLDTVANIANLVASPVWAGLSPTLKADYNLVASGNAAQLAALASSPIAGLQGVQLSTSATLDAVNDLTEIQHLATVVGSGQLGFAPGITLTIGGALASLESLTPGQFALATTVQLDAADAVSYWNSGGITLGAHQTLAISDNAANLVTNAGAIASHATVPVQLSGSATLLSADLHTILTLPNFSVGNYLLTLHSNNSITLSGTELQKIAAFGSSGFNANSNAITVNSAATLNAAGVAALFNDTITLSGANTAITLSDTAANLSALVLPNWIGTPTLTLSQSGSVTAAQLQSLASLGVNHTITDPGYAVTLSDANVTLTPAQYAALDQGPNSIIANLAPSAYTVSAPLSNTATITDTHNVLSFSDTNVPNATVKLYNEQGSLISATHEGQSSFTITASDPADAHGNGQFFVVTEVTNGVESAPLVVLDEGAIQAAVAAAGATFANAGDVTVSAGEHLAIYTAGAVPQNLVNPALVYDPHAHTVSLDIPNSAPIVLVTLGTSTDPAALTAADFIVKHHG